MKQLFYFILLLAGFSSIHSCKQLLDEDGNPLLDMNDNSGFTGPRALYREITDSDTLAEYHYNGLLLTKVLLDSGSVANVAYSGDKISKIDFMGFLDLDGDGDLDKDSISYTQLFTYGPTGRLETISENRSFFKRAPTIPAGPQTLYKKTKSIFNLKYDASTAKLDSIIMRNGPDASGTPFAYTDYSKTKYEYQGDNVAKVTRHYGPMAGGIFAAPTNKFSYEYFTYDTQISPFTLLPFAYKVSRLISTDINDKESFILSPNNPKRFAISDLMLPIPSPVIFTTDYSYDAQTYMKVGFGVNYIYKPL
ncbi:hypothetical protein ACM39_10510 [Chryseobacterium sp. FH2]|uniref:hypothetical protein n=1 Tax=Chryseobacterium sp. FH2 TaxID=1674291 RepID=UPI00065AAD1D|nr:hypothetical protein [Chryseobacterium sp. FH2]KMQ68261.1 hypothetical protein ACM39_10510 [Chryseobacterium sp. FH2]